MRAERVILSFVAVVIGLIAAGAAFYFYQMTKELSPDQTKPLGVASKNSPSPTPDNANLLTVDSPKDEEVFDKKTITISGKTTPKSNIIVSSENNDQVVTPTETGEFTLTESIENGTNIIQITAIFPNGEEKKVTRTVTYSTENF